MSIGIGFHSLTGRKTCVYRIVPEVLYSTGQVSCLPLDPDNVLDNVLVKVGAGQRPSGVGSHSIIQLTQVIARSPAAARKA